MLKIHINQYAKECVSVIIQRLKVLGVPYTKDFEKKRLLLESEVSGQQATDVAIDRILAQID